MRTVSPPISNPPSAALEPVPPTLTPVELAEIVGLRPLPCAGLLVMVTRRCPLSCAHCSSASTMVGDEPDPATLVEFVGTFATSDRPEVLLLTGGEPLLRPDLVVELAGAARRAGTRVALLTGGYFAARPVPARILRALRAVDHFSLSIDAFHERQIPRCHLFRLLHLMLDMGTAVSVHAVGSGPADPYLAGLVSQTRQEFGDRVPMLVNSLRAVGRAAAWSLAGPPVPDHQRVLPCAMAAWPVVAADGTVLACCNQDGVDRRPVPDHLRLGHIGTDTWPQVRDRALTSPVLRLIRATGPLHLRGRYGTPAGRTEHGYCGTCLRLGDHPEILRAAREVAAGRLGELLDEHAARVQFEAGPVALVRRHGCSRYADLVTLPHREGSR